MTTGSSGAVFFLGTRAHYQVLQQPESRFDAENGNASTESIYQNPSVDTHAPDNYIGERNQAYCDNEANNVIEEKEKEAPNGMKRRANRRQSEQILFDRDSEMKPALLNHLGGNETPKKPSRRRINLLTFLASLGRRKRQLNADSIQYLQHIESALTSCTYRESCRCLHCQSRYFDCDESEYSSEESDSYEYRYAEYPMAAAAAAQAQADMQEEDDDDEVFVDQPPDDNASTDLLLEAPKPPVRDMSISSEEEAREDAMELEVAAGTPVLLNYLLTHPITCAIQ